MILCFCLCTPSCFFFRITTPNFLYLSIPKFQHLSTPNFQHLSTPNFQHLSTPKFQHLSTPNFLQNHRFNSVHYFEPLCRFKKLEFLSIRIELLNVFDSIHEKKPVATLPKASWRPYASFSLTMGRHGAPNRIHFHHFSGHPTCLPAGY